MSIGRMISIAIAMIAVVGVFAYIPIVSDYAFWVLLLAYLVWEVIHKHNAKRHFRWEHMIELVVLITAIVAVFAEIPILSDYAFWVLFIAYLLSIGGTSSRA